MLSITDLALLLHYAPYRRRSRRSAFQVLEQVRSASNLHSQTNVKVWRCTPFKPLLGEKHEVCNSLPVTNVTLSTLRLAWQLRPTSPNTYTTYVCSSPMKFARRALTCSPLTSFWQASGHLLSNIFLQTSMAQANVNASNAQGDTNNSWICPKPGRCKKNRKLAKVKLTPKITKVAQSSRTTRGTFSGTVEP